MIHMSRDLRRIPEGDNQLDSELSNTLTKALVIYILKYVYRLYKRNIYTQDKLKILMVLKPAMGFTKRLLYFLMFHKT